MAKSFGLPKTATAFSPILVILVVGVIAYFVSQWRKTEHYRTAISWNAPKMTQAQMDTYNKSKTAKSQQAVASANKHCKTYTVEGGGISGTLISSRTDPKINSNDCQTACSADETCDAYWHYGSGSKFDGTKTLNCKLFKKPFNKDASASGIRGIRSDKWNCF